MSPTTTSNFLRALIASTDVGNTETPGCIIAGRRVGRPWPFGMCRSASVARSWTPTGNDATACYGSVGWTAPRQPRRLRISSCASARDALRSASSSRSSTGNIVARIAFAHSRTAAGASVMAAAFSMRARSCSMSLPPRRSSTSSSGTNRRVASVRVGTRPSLVADSIALRPTPEYRAASATVTQVCGVSTIFANTCPLRTSHRACPDDHPGRPHD